MQVAVLALLKSFLAVNQVHSFVQRVAPRMSYNAFAHLTQQHP